MYIYIERERDNMYVYIYIYIATYNIAYTPARPGATACRRARRSDNIADFYVNVEMKQTCDRQRSLQNDAHPYFNVEMYNRRAEKCQSPGSRNSLIDTSL